MGINAYVAFSNGLGGRLLFTPNTCDLNHNRCVGNSGVSNKKIMKKIFELELRAIEAPEGHTIVSAASSTFEIDFYNKHHFDYRGLIEKGLAIAVTEENNPYKKIKL